MTFPIYKHETKLSIDQVIALPKSEYPNVIGNYTGRPTFCLALDPEFLFYSINFPESYNHHPLYKLGEFKAELWKQDVFEIFIGDEESQQYQEFNFSPKGAYWKAGFTKYRDKLDRSDQPSPELKIDLRAILMGWTLTASIPLSLITVCDLNSSSCRINCAAIMGKEDRSFFSTSFIDSNKPDFHLKEQWLLPTIHQ